MGHRIVRFPEVGSTNDVALEAAEAGAEPGLVIQADIQVRGKGRRDRDWVSPAGGLWASVLMAPDVGPIHRGLVPLAVGCACADALERMEVDVRVRWPNDLMLEDRKVGGILVEARSRGDDLAVLVAGLGINVANQPPAPGAASLCEVLPELTPAELLEGILGRLRRYEQALSEGDARWICHRFMRHAWGIGREMLLDGEPCRPKEIAIDGALIVQRPGDRIDVVRDGSLRLPSP